MKKLLKIIPPLPILNLTVGLIILTLMIVRSTRSIEIIAEHRATVIAQESLDEVCRDCIVQFAHLHGIDVVE